MAQRTRRGPAGANETLAPLFTWRSAICESDLKPTTRHVAVTLSLYMNERGGSAHPGASRLADDTGLHVSTVRAELGRLLADGWLAMVEQGGLKGERRIANAYEARFPPKPLPLVVDDPSLEATGNGDRVDPSSSPRRPVVQADPISSGSLHELNLSEGAIESPPDVSVASHSTKSYIASYVNWFQEAHGTRPWKSYIDRMAKELSTSEAKECTATEIKNAVYCIAKEGKRPNVLLDVIGDYRREVAS